MTQSIQAMLPHIKLLTGVSLSEYTYTKTGGVAEYLAFPKTIEEVKQLVDYVNANDMPLTILGNASNVIVSDNGLRGLVMMLTDMDTISHDGELLTAYSGAKLIDVSAKARDLSLAGLAFACGIPGSVGGAVYMNAGAYGGEIKDVLKEITVVTLSGDICVVPAEELAFAYRYSRLQESHDIVIAATFALTVGNQDDISAEMAHLTELRESKQPLEYPSCGSVFKRPPGYFAGKLIQDAGLQGKTWGGVQVSEKHAGFIVNINNGTASDYIQLIQHIQEEVFAQFGVRLETEVRVIRNDEEVQDV